MRLTLVVLAAGVGSRYGGPKQIDRVGPGGATLLDYAAHDAWRAGFTDVVLVVREGMADELREAVGHGIERRLRVSYAVQGLALPGGYEPPARRTKPWGTGHAVLAALPLVDGPFAVVNADDFYGAASYRQLARFLTASNATPAGAVPEFAMVAFPLASTLSPDGPVSRGLCSVDGGGYLLSIREALKVIPDGPDARELDAEGGSRQLPGDTPVSLNFWGFAPGFAPALEAGFRRFLEAHAGSTTAEYYLLSAVQDLIAAGHARVRVLSGGGPWSGLTHPGDRPRLVALVESLVAAGDYPAALWA